MSAEKDSNAGSISLEEMKVDLEAVDVVYASSVGGAERPPMQLTPEEERRIYRKIDLRLLPILTIMYLASYLDRGTFSIRLSSRLLLTAAI